MSSERLTALCAAHGVALNPDDVAKVAAIAGGGLLAKLLALLEKWAPLLAPVMPQILADMAAGNYLAAIMLILETLAHLTPTPTPTPAG